MGDRTWVRIYVLADHTERAKEILGKEACYWEDKPENRKNTYAITIFEEHPYKARYFCSLFEFDEANYGGGGLAEDLIADCIPFDLEHGAGDEYDEGSHHARFTPEGELEVLEYPDWLRTHMDIAYVEQAMWGPIRPEKVGDRIKEAIQKHRNRTIPRSWDQQYEYSARARVRKIITK